MKKLKDYIIYEGVLSNVDDTLQTTDEWINTAENDWAKLLKTRRVMHDIGDCWCIKIKSPELANYFLLGLDIPEQFRNTGELVILSFNTSDVLYNKADKELFITIKSRLRNLAISNISYCDKNDSENMVKQASDDVVTIKTACDIILDTISKSKLLKNLTDVKKEFDKNI